MTHAEPTLLVRKARDGCSESLDKLAANYRPRLEQYVFRLTLDHNLTQDVVQETLVDMVKTLGKLEKADRFWPWLRRMAFNKTRDAQAGQRRRRQVLQQAGGQSPNGEGPLARMIRDELGGVVMRAMRGLRADHRRVLTMRCYEDMDYPEIAEVMERSVFATRMLFVRAKKSLQKELARAGVAKGGMLTALVVFGKLTAATEASAAQTTVSAATLKVGLGASVAAAVTAKTTVAVVVGAAALGTGVAVIPPALKARDIDPQKMKGVEQVAPVSLTTPVQPVETWYYYPHGSAGPVLRRMIVRQEKGHASYCQWLYDGQTSRRYDPASNTIYTMNANPYAANLSIPALPTDSRQLAQALSGVDGYQAIPADFAALAVGSWAIHRHDADTAEQAVQVSQHPNLLTEESFRNPWPADARTVDLRGEAHQRGWMYFRVSGQINGQRVSGQGRMPLVATMAKDYYPWLYLRIGDREFVDTPDGACICAADGKTLASYPAGTFFVGLGRPWTGLHSVDTVRRDAAAHHLSFTTRRITESHNVHVAVINTSRSLLYSIDLQNDFVENIEFTTSTGTTLGQLKFTYLQQLPQDTNEFIEPRPRRYGSLEDRMDTLLLMKIDSL